MFKDYSSHQPQQTWPVVRPDGDCSPQTTGVPTVTAPALDDRLATQRLLHEDENGGGNKLGSGRRFQNKTKWCLGL